MPASKLTIATITGTHTGKEEGHLGTGRAVIGQGLVVVVVVMFAGALGRLLILVKMKGLAYRKHSRNEELICERIVYPNILKIQPQRSTLQFRDYGLMSQVIWSNTE